MTVTTMPDTKVKTWLRFHKLNPHARLRLLCFPYAGGSSQIYREWQKALPEHIDVCAIELPGRGQRVGDAPFTRLHKLVTVAAEDLLPIIDRPFALFGHSMGALIAFDLAHRLREKHGIEPVHLMVSSRRAPHVPTDRITYNLPEAEFLAELNQLNGTPGEVFKHPELMELLMPLLRADFELIQTYEYLPKPPLNCPLSVFGGSEDDEVSDNKLAAWREYTKGDFSIQIIPGDHFFINTSRQQLLERVARTLASTTTSL